MTQAEERALAQHAARGDLAAFAALVRVQEPRLRRFTNRLAGEDGDDLAQEAFLAAFRSIGQWRGDGSFAAWLKRIAVRRFLDRLRRTGPKTFDPIDEAMPADDPGIERKLTIDRALAGLPPRERAASLLVFAEGHTHQEAALMLAVPLGTLKSITARAKSELKKSLEGMEA